MEYKLPLTPKRTRGCCEVSLEFLLLKDSYAQLHTDYVNLVNETSQLKQCHSKSGDEPQTEDWFAAFDSKIMEDEKEKSMEMAVGDKRYWHPPAGPEKLEVLAPLPHQPPPPLLGRRL